MPVLTPEGAWAPVEARPARPPSAWSWAAALGWGIGCAPGGAAGWLAACGVTRMLFGPGPALAVGPGHLAETAAIEAGVSGTVGLLLGLIAGLIFGPPHRFRAALAGGTAGIVAGAIGGGLGPVIPAIGWGLGPAVSGSIAWGLAGLIAGPVGYAGSRWVRNPDRTSAAGSHSGVGRLLPVLAIAGACLVAVVVTAPSPAGWAVLAVGLLGLAVTWALAGQERRLRELEQMLADRMESEDLTRF